MYLHLGHETSLPTDAIIGIFDLDTATLSHHTRAFLTRAQKESRVVNVSAEDLPRSFVLAGGKPGRLYISPLASSTLKKRSLSPTLPL